MSISRPRERRSAWRIELPMKLPPGRHELMFVTDLGVLASDTTLRGLDGKPGTADKRPGPVVRRRATNATRVK